MSGPRGAGHSGVMQARPQQRGRVDGPGEPGPGRPGDVEPPAAGEGQAVSGAGAHSIRGNEERCSVFHDPFDITYTHNVPFNNDTGLEAFLICKKEGSHDDV